MGTRLAWRRRWLAALLGLGLCGPALAQREPDWVRDMPTVADVTRQIQGANTAQTLGRQCAALTRLWRGSDLPGAYQFNPTPAMKALSESYRQGLNTLQQRYGASVKPLNVEANKQEWSRMCGNYQSGVHPVTGKPDAGYPALDQRVTEAQWIALLKPAAQAAYEKERQDRAARAASSRAQQERQAQARAQQEAEDLWALAWAGGVVLGSMLLFFAGLALMLRQLSQTRWTPEPGKRQIRLRGQWWDVRDRCGVVLGCHKSLETVVSGGASSTGGGPNNAPVGVSVSISSHTIVHWDIRLGTPDGGQQDLRLRDWEISVQPGDLLQLFWLARSDRETPFVLIYNRSTREHWSDNGLVVLYYKLMSPGDQTAFWLVVLFGFLTFGLGWVAGFWWRWRMANKARRAAREVVDWLVQLPPPVISMSPA